MAYVLTIGALAAVFLLAAPAHDSIADKVRSLPDALNIEASDVSARFHAVIGSVREKSMELLRRELHRSIDSLGR